MMAVVDTKERILDVAEQLFAQKGYSATSMRTITSQAGVNLAAANYHFGSKQRLYQAVFERRVEPMNEARIAYLDELERKHEGREIPLEEILRAFIEPALRASRDPALGGYQFIRLLGRTHAEPGPEVREFLPALYEETKIRYKVALARVLPHLSEEELSWRVHFVIGTIAYTLAGTDALEMIASCRFCDPSDVEGIIQRMVPFLAGALRAPASMI